MCDDDDDDDDDTDDDDDDGDDTFACILLKDCFGCIYPHLNPLCPLNIWTICLLERSGFFVVEKFAMDRAVLIME